MCGSATTKERHIILDFDIVSEIITFEEKGRFWKEKHNNSDKCKALEYSFNDSNAMYFCVVSRTI